jgi:predicted ATPase/transcriptional regulator with XRE-family HTH domain
MTMTSPATFGALLRHHRLVAGLTQEALAERAGVSARGIQLLERDRTAPRAETVRLLADALALDAEARATLIAASHPELASAAPSAPPRRVAGLPAPPTPLVGRAGEIAAASALLRGTAGVDGARLVTLTGPGGVGKTRLALAVAAALAADFGDDVVWVDLALVRDPALVAAAVARALGVRETGDRPLSEMLSAAVAGRHLLLALDNLEHLLAAAPLIADLLAAGPRLAVLVTSRARLRLRGEREMPVPPLAVPAVGDSPVHLDEVTNTAAVRLFVDRAGEVQPGFVLTQENAEAVVEICRRLDGLPLAIELAAARVKVLPPAELRLRLQQRLPLLSGGARDLPLRQQTMRDAIAWSYDLLLAEEQNLFRRLAVFAGGATLDAAEWVVGGSAWGVDDGPAPTTQHPAPCILDLLASLVDQSLLRTSEGAEGTPRYVMLETVRDYGLERLHDSGESDQVRRAHAAYYLGLAERTDAELTGPGQARGLERLAIEHDNLRAALTWALADGGDATAARLVGTLWRFWWLRGYLSEGRAYAEAAAAQGRGTAAERARTLYAAGSLAQEQGDYEPAAPLLEAGLAAAREAGDQPVAALCLNELGFIARDLGDYGRAAALHEEALTLHRAAGDRRGIAVSLGNLGEIAIDRGDYERGEELMAEVAAVFRALGDRQALATALSNRCDAASRRGDHERARPFCEEALAVNRELEDRQRTAMALMSLTRVAIGSGDWGRAAAVCTEALDLARELGLKRLTAEALRALGVVALAEGDPRRASSLLRESLKLLRQTDNKEEIAATLETVAQASVTCGSAERAARLHGAAVALRERIGAPLPPAERASVERTVALIGAALGAKTLAAETAGRELTQEEAVAEALTLTEALAVQPDRGNHITPG